jgi:NAD(P)H dehydrogenase (quinone)
MGKLLVMFHSNTDCTAQMAAYVAEGARMVGDHEVRVKCCDEATHADVIWCDGLAVGTPTNLGGIAWRMKQWWDEFATDHWGKCDGKLATVFSSQGGHGGGGELTCQAMSTVLMNFGFLSFGVTDYVGKIYTLHYGAVVAKAPRNETDRLACQRLGLRLAEWTSVFVDGHKAMHPILTTKRAEANDKADTAKAGAKAAVVHVVIAKEVPLESQPEWLKMAAELSKCTLLERGVLKYTFVKSTESSTRFVIVEEWESAAHLEAHFQTGHFLRLVPLMDAISTTISVDKSHDALGGVNGRAVVAPPAAPKEQDILRA